MQSCSGHSLQCARSEDAHRILSAAVPGRKTSSTTWYCFQRIFCDPTAKFAEEKKKKNREKSAMAGLECGLSQAIHLLPPNKPAVCLGCGSRVALWAWLEQKMHLSVSLKCPQLDYMGIRDFQVHSQTLTWELGKHSQSCQLIWWFSSFLSSSFLYLWNFCYWARLSSGYERISRVYLFLIFSDLKSYGSNLFLSLFFFF